MKTPRIKVTADIMEVVIDELIFLGVSPCLQGYEYAKTGICLILENPRSAFFITRDLYPVIAQEHNSTPSRVERSLRHAIERMYLYSDLDVLQKYFGLVVSSNSGRVTNSQFLSVVAERIRKKVGVYSGNYSEE